MATLLPIATLPCIWHAPAIAAKMDCIEAQSCICPLSTSSTISHASPNLPTRPSMSIKHAFHQTPSLHIPQPHISNTYQGKPFRQLHCSAETRAVSPEHGWIDPNGCGAPTKSRWHEQQ
ncbi:hypothetical protein V2J09_018453 [Rumex salicifolius]